MKKLKRMGKVLLLTGILGILLGISALAAAKTAGIYGIISEEKDILLTPGNGTATQMEIQGEKRTLYIGADTLKLTYLGQEPGPYAVWVLRGEEASPTSERIAYLNQGDGTTFLLQPKTLEPGVYGVYLSGASMDFRKVGSFRYYAEAEEPEPEPTEPKPVENPFVDVSPKDYFYAPVLWAVESQVTAGTDATHFTPNGTCTRAQVISFLWRAAGKPEPKSTRMPFQDVAAGSYYHKAVGWAVEQGIAAGTDSTHFSPNAGCTRAQVMSFLWRYAGKPGGGSGSNPFLDVKQGDYYYEAVLWAVRQGVTAGTDRVHFSPDSVCTRAQAVSFLWRYRKPQKMLVGRRLGRLPTIAGKI